MAEEKLIDGSLYALGRLSSAVAKLLIGGEKVVVVNAGKIVISGRRDIFLREREIGTPRRGPEHPKKPSGIVKKSIRGMLPRNKMGREMLGRLRVYDGLPHEYERVEFIDLGIERFGGRASHISLEECYG
jgi:large subunit ribosomal protein L13